MTLVYLQIQLFYNNIITTLKSCIWTEPRSVVLVKRHLIDTVFDLKQCFLRYCWRWTNL